MPGVIFMQAAPNPFRTEATSLENDAHLDLHKAGENITPAKEFFEKQDIDAKTKEAIAIAAHNGLKEYAAEGIKKFEQLLQGFSPEEYEYVVGVGERIDYWRVSEVA